jgi:hypothetical protein
MKIAKAVLVAVFLTAILVSMQPAMCWSNGGYSADRSNPDYGTHDWIAQHALDYLPAEEKQFFTHNLEHYLFGTELPDLPATQGGYGDTTKHHIYYDADGALTDDASAKRAQTMLDTALRMFREGKVEQAMEAAGAMTHYIADMAVFGHVMGSSTSWGTEVHHQDYEDYVNKRTAAYQSGFTSYLSFDGNLTILTAGDAAKNLAYGTTFGGANEQSCTWMDQNYNWSSTAFRDRCGESLNFAVNAVADVLHTFDVELELFSTIHAPTASPSQTYAPTPTVPEFPATTLLAFCGVATAIASVIKRQQQKK